MQWAFYVYFIGLERYFIIGSGGLVGRQEQHNDYNYALFGDISGLRGIQILQDATGTKNAGLHCDEQF